MQTTFGSMSHLAGAPRRAVAAHGAQEKRTSQADPDWPDRYAECTERDQADEKLPT